MRRHDTDVTSMVFGLVFLGVATAWLLVDSDRVSVPELAVLGPVVLLVAGVLGLVATIAGSARSRRQQQASARPDEGVQHLEDSLGATTVEGRPVADTGEGSDTSSTASGSSEDLTQQLRLGPREES